MGLELMPIKTLNNIKRLVVKIRSDALVLYICYKDIRTPLSAKLVSLLALALAFSPIDIIPDFIPVLGYLDDIIIIPLLIYIAFRLIPDVIISDSRHMVQTMCTSALPVFKKTGIFLALIWITAAAFIVLQIFKFFNQI